jgi:putative copper export protein
VFLPLLLLKTGDLPLAPQVVLKYVEFLGYFAIYGALGFRLLLSRLNSLEAWRMDGTAPLVFRRAETGAARIGLVGAALLLLELAAAAGQNTSAALLAPKTAIQIAFALVALFAFAAVMRRRPHGWHYAAVAGCGFVLRNVASGKSTALVNPLHEAGAALWLGTLFVIIAAGMPAISRSAAPRDWQRTLFADLVAYFAPLALGAAGLMAITGIITAWTHLKYWAALWTTSYGYALDAKLGVFAIVLALGAWNWRFAAPKLKAEETAALLRRSSSLELAFAALVLALTAVLVLLPSPKLPVR